MNENTPESTENEVELPAIEFQSPGRFSVHNPSSLQAEAPEWEPAPFGLGSHDRLERFSNPDDARAHALSLMQQARRRICLYTPDLEPWLYHNSAIQQACTRLLVSDPKCQLRILVRDLSRAVKEGHRLLSLSRRVSSNFQIRRINPDHPSEDLAYLIADDRGLLVRPEPEQYAGYALYNDPGRTRLQQTRFDQAWDLSITDPDLRSFLI
ncbi:histone acetyltransferase HPA2 [Metapseudomonas lalkuanensis]|uniref:Histone acetyltransferase HPA2 n=1 Tax=Metapseudomonas lalkuanensis TaxID=2604832 RepID=A0A5J6QLU4_9GAMM|nr:histone acetyltransferase HPA2 [Pseudomonas lalkuanensis]QEY63423.1 histone acetyltransferase HPA2 [Pseudomonas lalkuanensis]